MSHSLEKYNILIEKHPNSHIISFVITVQMYIICVSETALLHSGSELACYHNDYTSVQLKMSKKDDYGNIFYHITNKIINNTNQE